MNWKCIICVNFLLIKCQCTSYYTASAAYRFKNATKSSTFTRDLGWKNRTNTLCFANVIIACGWSIFDKNNQIRKHRKPELVNLHLQTKNWEHWLNSTGNFYIPRLLRLKVIPKLIKSELVKKFETNDIHNLQIKWVSRTQTSSIYVCWLKSYRRINSSIMMLDKLVNLKKSMFQFRMFENKPKNISPKRFETPRCGPRSCRSRITCVSCLVANTWSWL